LETYAEGVSPEVIMSQDPVTPTPSHFLILHEAKENFDI
jgi:hypothetical protein